MFIVHHSNCIELFMKLVINIMSSRPLSDPMQSEIIIIDHKIMEKWIEIRLARHFGISANIMFMNMASFIKRIFSDTLSSDVDIQSFSQNFIFWKLMEILPKLSMKKTCFMIQKYLYNDVNQQKLGQLSEKLANLFLEYLIYRSDWLNYWSLGKILDNIDVEYQVWQSEVWRALSQHILLNLDVKLNFWDSCINLIQKNTQKINYSTIPNRIFIYGVISIPPVYWRILNVLSDYIDIYFWFIDSCINSWQYVVHNRSNSNVNIHNNNLNDQYNSRDHVKFKHDLLQRWGQTGQDTLFALGKLENFFAVKAFTIPKPDSILHILQKDILETRLNSKLIVERNKSYFISLQNTEKYILQSSDHSFTIHMCHNIHREIEVLHDNLLSILSKDSELSPGEIVVMAPNISDYESSIRNVFNNIFHRQLPFTISSNLEHNMNPIILTLFKILEISYSRFNSEVIMSLLSVSSVASRFNISIKEVQLLKKWIIKSGIRWGLDNNTMYSFDLPITDQNTWFFGLRRMLLGYAINSESGLWNDIFPYDYVHEEYISLISRLGNFLNTLKKWRDRLQSSHTLVQWMSYIQDIINNFFDCNNLNSEENKALFLFKNCWINIIQSGIQSGYSKLISSIVLIDMLKTKLYQKRINYQFLPNVINFFDINPICFIPCKVLCIIGMNDDVFPRDVISCNFNLIFQQAYIGDYNIRKEDCYSFLLACLLPTQKMYISVISKLNDHNNNVYNSSKLVEELLEYITQKFYFIKTGHSKVFDNIKKLRQHLCKQYSCMPFDVSNFVDSFDKTTTSFADEWIPAVNTSVNLNFSTCSHFRNGLSCIPITIISYYELHNFYCHPIRAWFQKRLGVFFPFKHVRQLLNYEPFSIDHLHRFALNMQIIDCLLNNKNIDELYHESRASGILPCGSFGNFFWIEAYTQMYRLANQIKPFFFPDQIYTLDFSVKIGTITLIGQLDMVQKTGLIRWKPSSLSMKDCFLLWIEHVIYCSIGCNGDSQLFGINNVWRFPNLSKTVAKKILFSLINGYCVGIAVPLMLLHRSGGAWINYVFDWKNKTIRLTDEYQKQARYKLIQTWQGNDDSKHFFSLGENQDPYLRKLIPFHLEEENIQDIINVAKHYFLNVMKFRIL